MGGGDLNSKKSWHPNTMKNQERVWKAEQAAAEEKKRIMELQRERAEERDRAELNDLARRTAGSSNDDRLNWMYDKPDKKADNEDYLLGKTIEKNYGQNEKDDQDVIPAVARRVVGSSMLSSSGDGQVDLARKMREDPLLLVKERERAARAALLNNPLQRRRLTELLRKEQEQKQKKVKNKTKTKGNLDDKLAAKLTALSGQTTTIDIAKLLDSDDSSSDSEEESKHKKKKKKRKEEKTKKKEKKAKKKSRRRSESETSIDEKLKKHFDKYKDEGAKEHSSRKKSESRKRNSDGDLARYDNRKGSESSHRRRRDSSHSGDDERVKRRKPYPDSSRRSDIDKRRTGLSEEEKAAKLAEMAMAGAAREVERGRRVAAQRAEDAAPAPSSRAQARPARALPDSLEARIHSNRHYIQRDKRHMNEHFARR